MSGQFFPRPRCLLLIACLCWLATGCYLPLKQTQTGSRGSFADWPDLFETGQTTRTEVLLALGEPDDVSDDESVLTYRQSTVDGVIIVSQCTPAFEMTTDTVIRLTFDDVGILEDIDIAVES